MVHRGTQCLFAYIGLDRYTPRKKARRGDSYPRPLWRLLLILHPFGFFGLMLKQEEESYVNTPATERIVSNLVEPEYAGSSEATPQWPGGECRSEIPGPEITSEVEGERGTKAEGPFPETNWSEVSRDKSWLDMSDSLNLSCSPDVGRNLEESSDKNPSSIMGDAGDSMMIDGTLGKIKGEEIKESNLAGELSAGLSVGFKRPLPDTEEGRAILDELSLPMAKLSFKYEPNPFEYMSSRWMSLIPNPFVPVVNLALASMMDSIRQPSVALENAKKRLSASSVPEGSGPPPSRAPGTAYAAHMFSEAERLTTRITEKASSVDVNVTRVSELIPDLTLFSNSYA